MPSNEKVICNVVNQSISCAGSWQSNHIRNLYDEGDEIDLITWIVIGLLTLMVIIVIVGVSKMEWKQRQTPNQSRSIAWQERNYLR